MSPVHYTLTALDGVFIFTAGTGAPTLLFAIFAARNKALLLVLGVIAGACTLLGRGFGFSGVAVPLPLAWFVAAAGTVVTPAEVEGRDEERRDAALVVDVWDITREGGGRDGVRWTEAAEVGRESMGRDIEGWVYEFLDEERDGTWFDDALRNIKEEGGATSCI